MFCFRCRSWQRIELAGSKAQKAFMLSFFFSFQFKMWQKYWISRGQGVAGQCPGEISVFIYGTNCRVWRVWHLLLGDHIGRFLATPNITLFVATLLLSSTGAGQFLLSVSFHVAFPFCITPIKFSLSLFNFHPIYFHFPLCCLTMNLV